MQLRTRQNWIVLKTLHCGFVVFIVPVLNMRAVLSVAIAVEMVSFSLIGTVFFFAEKNPVNTFFFLLET